jgi:GDP-D-mannose dehydratase
LGDSRKARSELGWSLHNSTKETIREMVLCDFAVVTKN